MITPEVVHPSPEVTSPICRRDAPLSEVMLAAFYIRWRSNHKVPIQCALGRMMEVLLHRRGQLMAIPVTGSTASRQEANSPHDEVH